ncbi:MAG: fibronectin type III domain-containing protein [Candidatus Thermoplasmatota archaeon]
MAKKNGLEFRSRERYSRLAIAAVLLTILVYSACNGEASRSPTTENGLYWITDIVDSETEVGGWYTSIALDGNNWPRFSYYDNSNGDLKYARWNGSAWAIETIDSEGRVGDLSDIVIDTNNYPHISYYDWTNKNLKYAKWTGSDWAIETVDSGEDVGYGTSIAVDSNNYPHIAYYDYGNGDLKYARWNGSAWNIKVVDGEAYGEVCGAFPSIALGPNDHPHISYYQQSSPQSNYDLKYAHWTGETWSTEIVDSEGDVGQYSSIALDSYGYPHISYYDFDNNDLKYARWNGSAWSIAIVDSAGWVGEYTSIAVGTDNFPQISYYDREHYDLKYARWNGSAWAIETIDSEGDVGRWSAIVLDGRNCPHISHIDWGQCDLKYTFADCITPSSSVNTISPFWHNISLISISATAADHTPGSGIKSVRLYYRYSTDNSSWGSWTLFGVDTTSPYEWSFASPNGDGYYQFYSIAIDNATHAESPPEAPDTVCGIDTTAPSQVTNIKSIKITETSITLTWDKNTDLDFNRYEIYGATKEDFSNAKLVATIYDRNTTTYTVTGLSPELSPGTTYYFKVNVIDNAGNMRESSLVSFTTLTPPSREVINWLLIIVVIVIVLALIALLGIARARKAKKS